MSEIRTSRFRFRPRYRWLALIAAAAAVALLVARFAIPLAGISGVWASVGGAVGLVLAALYLASPAWRIEVVIDDLGLEVLARSDRRFRLAWDEVVRVIASSATSTCFVDGGAPDRSLLVPGVGAPAAYDIENKQALFDAIVARAPADAVVWVDLLESANIDEADADEADAADGTSETDAVDGTSEADAADGVSEADGASEADATTDGASEADGMSEANSASEADGASEANTTDGASEANGTSEAGDTSEADAAVRVRDSDATI